MSPNRRSNERSKLRMDTYSKNDHRSKGVLDTRREIDKVIKKARRDGTQSAYWTKKLLEVEAKEPDRWHHSGFKELYVKSSTNSGDSSRESSVTKTRPAPMYSPSAPTSPVATARASRRSSSNTRRNDRRSVSSEMRRGGSRSRTDKFSSSARPRTSASPFRRAKSPNRSRSPVRRSRSPVRRNNRSPVRRPSPAPRTTSPSRARKSPGRRTKSSLRSRSPVGRAKSPASRLSKADKAERRNRSVDKVSPSLRRKKSPKLPRYRSGTRSPLKSPVRRRSRLRSRSPLSKSSKRKTAEYRLKAHGSSSSRSRFSSTSPFKKNKNNKSALSDDVLSSSDCSDSNCSMCRFEKGVKEKRTKKMNDKEKSTKRPPPPPEPKLKPRAALPRLPPQSSSRYARSRSFSAPLPSSPLERKVESSKHKKKSSKKDKKKAVVKASKAVTTSIIHHKKIKVESPSDESESPSPKRITLSERFGKMAKWNQKKEVESNQRNIRVTAGDNYRVEELDVPLLELFPEPSPLLLDGSWDDVRVRYTYYKEQGFLEDLTFQDYLKWEEWWYSYQEYLDSERMHSAHSVRRRI